MSSVSRWAALKYELRLKEGPWGFKTLSSLVNTLRPKQNGRHFADDILKCIFLNENVWIPKKISLKFVPKGPINNNPALVQVMAWRRSGDKPLSEPMLDSLLTHICVTRPQWVKCTNYYMLAVALCEHIPPCSHTWFSCKINCICQCHPHSILNVILRHY